MSSWRLDELPRAENVEHIGHDDAEHAAPPLIRKRVRGKQQCPPAYRQARHKRWRAGAFDAADEHPILRRPAGRAQPVRRRPAAWEQSVRCQPSELKRHRRTFPNEQCPGQEQAACIFSTRMPGHPAHLHPGRGQTHCMFCHDDELARIIATKDGSQLTKTLLKLQALAPRSYGAALVRLQEMRGQDFVNNYADRVRRRQRPPNRCVRRNELRRTLRNGVTFLRAGRESAARSARRNEKLTRNSCSKTELGYAASSTCQKRSADVNARKFYIDKEERDNLQLDGVDDVTNNDTGLPLASVSERAQFLELCCKFGWQMCENGLQPSASPFAAD